MNKSWVFPTVAVTVVVVAAALVGVAAAAVAVAAALRNYSTWERSSGR